MGKNRCAWGLGLEKVVTKIRISKIMVTDVKTIDQGKTVAKVVELMSNLSIAGMIITDKSNKPVGMVSEGDIIKKVFSKGLDPKKIKIKDIMTKGLVTIPPELSIGQTSVLMRKKNISKLPVVKNTKLVGYVTKSDLLEELNDIYLQNRRLIWLTVMTTIQFIIIAVLLIMYISK